MAWEKLGSTKIGARTPDFEATNNTGWTQVGTGVTIDSAGKITTSSASANARVYKALGFTSHASNWVLDFEFTRTSASGSNVRPIYVSDNTNPPADSSDNDALGGYGDTNFNLFKKEGTTHTPQGHTANTQSTKYYGRMIRTSDTSFKVTMSTSSANRDAGSGGTVTQSITASAIGALSYIGSANGTTSGNHTNEVENIKFYNGTTTVANTSDIITVDSLEAKKHLMVQGNLLNSGELNTVALQFNSDTGNNYSRRYSVNGGVDATDTSQPSLEIEQGSAWSGDCFFTAQIINEAAKEKLVQSEWIDQQSTGAGSAPRRAEVVGKWSNTSNAITTIKVIQDGSGSFAEGSEVTVYGTD